MSVLLLIGGFVLLVGGGEALVRGAASLGRTVGLSSLIIGLTVVSSATSAPELAVSTGAALSGSPGLAVGNVVGSNIANILFVLGLTAVFGTLPVRRQLIRADIPVMIVLSVLALLLAMDGTLSTADGSLLLFLLLVYLVGIILYARRRKAKGQEPDLAVEEAVGPVGGGSCRGSAPPPVARWPSTSSSSPSASACWWPVLRCWSPGPRTSPPRWGSASSSWG